MFSVGDGKDYKMDFYKKVLMLIDKRGITKTQFTKAVKINHTTLYTWKSRTSKPSIEIMVRVARFFGVTVDSLADDDMSVTYISEDNSQKIMNSIFNTENLIHNIIELCEKENISVNCMLQKCGLDKSVMDDLRKGFDPQLGKMVVIADYFSVTVDYLINNKTVPDRNGKEGINYE